MADEKRVESLFQISDHAKLPRRTQAHPSIPNVATPPPLQVMNHYGPTLTPPPAHLQVLGHTPPPPHIQVHSVSASGTLHTPPPAHMNDHRSSPGLQLLGQVAASPQLRIHSTPSPHLSIHSSGSPAHPGLLGLDRPSSREFSMTPPRAQVFPHAGLQPELMKVLRPGLPPLTNTLALPNGPYIPTASLSPNQALFQQAQQAAAVSMANQIAAQQQLQYLQAIQQHQQQQAANDLLLSTISHQQALASQHQPLLSNSLHHSQHNAVAHGHQSPARPSRLQTSIVSSPHKISRSSPNVSSHSSTSVATAVPASGQPLSIASSISNSLYQSYNNIAPPEPSPHQELKMLANIASSELGKINSSPDKYKEKNNNRLQTKLKIHSQRILNLNNFPSSTPYASSYRSRSIAMQRARATCITSSAKSLDILRQVVQTRINEEVKTILDRYVNMYFRPAVTNIRDNNGQSSASEEHIQCICRKILEEASRMYMGSNGLRSRSPTPDVPDNLSDAGSMASGKRSPKLPFSRLKRKPQSDTESEASSYRKRVKRGRGGGHGTSSLAKSEPVRKDGPRWDPGRIRNTTLFIMGSKANKALGLGNTRGRIYLKHPELFKYTGDSEDKVWLYENARMPGTGGKAYMMILEDIQDLCQTSEYKDIADTSCLKGFSIPDWMVEKAKKQMQSSRTEPSATEPAPKPKLKAISNLVQQENYDADSDKNVPFKSAASSRKSLSDSKIGVNSPANTEEMELLSSEDLDEPPVSPFGSAEDYAPVSPGNSGSSLKPDSPSALVLGLTHDPYSMT